MENGIAGGDPTDTLSVTQQIRNLREELRKAEQGRRDAETRAVAVETESSSAVCNSLPGPSPVNDIELLLTQLDTDYSTLTYTIDSLQLQIPPRVCEQLAQLLQNDVEQRIQQVREKVHALGHSIQASNGQARTDALSTTRAAALSAIQKLQAFNRQIQNQVNNESGDATANLTFGFEPARQLDDLNLDELLEEFKIAAERPIQDDEKIKSLREHLRVAKAAQWKAERDADKAKQETNEALLRLGLTQR